MKRGPFEHFLLYTIIIWLNMIDVPYLIVDSLKNFENTYLIYGLKSRSLNIKDFICSTLFENNKLFSPSRSDSSSMQGRGLEMKKNTQKNLLLHLTSFKHVIRILSPGLQSSNAS